MDEDGAPFDSGFDDDGPFRGTPEAGGVSLESALRDFGPAAIDDLFPRVRSLSSSLDAAHAAGVVHGALHPSRIIINDEVTSIVRGIASSAPYLAPEVVAGGAATPRSDQFSLAAITYEWMFGRPISGPARRSVEVRPMPGVDRVALSEAFTRALGREPADRFASCTEFCDALAKSEISELPLLGSELPLLGAESEEDEDDPIGPFLPEEPSPNVEPVTSPIEHASLAGDHVPPPIDDVPPSIDDVKIVAEESIVTAGQPDLDSIDSLNHREDEAPFSALPDEPAPALASWNPSAAAPPRSMESPRFGGFALIIAAIVGSVFGFAAGYMARPRALQSGPPETMASAPRNDSPAAAPAQSVPVAKAAEPAPSVAAPREPSAPTPQKTPSAAPPAPAAPSAVASVGRLLVRSTPSGASVSVNGIAKGVTPLALGDLAVGTSDVTIARRGFITETRKVQITRARPSRSLDVRLSAAASATPPRPSTPATIGRPPAPPATAATTTGGLSIDSRPAGAAVTINGKPSGVTPVTINDLPPGEYRILMALPGYHDFATSVRVVAGERARAAASLTAQEKE